MKTKKRKTKKKLPQNDYAYLAGIFDIPKPKRKKGVYECEDYELSKYEMLVLALARAFCVNSSLRMDVAIELAEAAVRSSQRWLKGRRK